MNRAKRQLALPFTHEPSYGPDFLQADSNADALAWLERPADWPQRRLALWGGQDSGKTHLMHLWAGRSGARLMAGATLPLADPQTPLAIDDADAAPPLPLLHTLNAAAESGLPVLLAARMPPARWEVTLPDLASRLRAMTAVEIGPAEDSLLRSLLARLLSERQLAVPESLQDWMLLRLARSAGAVREAAARLDRASLRARRPPNQALADEVIAALAHTDAPDELHAGETSSEDRRTTSPDRVPVL